MAAQWEAKDKNFIITGSASGLGAAYVQTFLKNGAKNVAVLDIADEAGKKFVATLNETYPNRAIFIKCDVGKEDNIVSSFNAVLDKFKQIDVLINNAGIMNDSEDVWRKANDVNLQGVVSFTMKAVKHMRKDEGGAGGVILNISSTAALWRLGFLPIYSGAKAAVLHFSQSLAADQFYEKTEIRVLTVCFGPTDTDLMQRLNERFIDHTTSVNVKDAIPLQSVESAVQAVLKMFREGKGGSVWLSVNNKPGQDITHLLGGFYNELRKLII